MIKLDTITRSLQIVLSAAKTITDMPVVVSYSERTATASTTTEGTQLASSNGTTAVTICAAPASGTIVRSVEHISVKNADTAAKTVTINLLDNATNYALITVTLAVGDELTYTAYAGWNVIDASGFIKTTPLTTMTSAQLAAILSDETGTGVVVFSDSPTLTGTPLAPTATAGISTTQIATTAYVPMVLIQSQSASNSATVDFTSIYNTVFTSYILVCDRVIPATNATSLRMQVSFGGTWQSGAGAYTHNDFRFTAAGTGVDGSAADTSISLSGVAETLGNTNAAMSFSGTFTISNPLQTSTDAHWYGQYSMYASSSARIVGVNGGAMTASSARDGFRIFMSSGNITSGTFKLYGVK